MIAPNDDRLRAPVSAETRKEFKKQRAAVRRKTRFRVFDRDGWCCAYCGANLARDLDTLLSSGVDHVIPRGAGGRNDAENLVASCAVCNSLKAGTACMSLAEAKELVSERRSMLIAESLSDLAEIGATLPEGSAVGDALLHDRVVLDVYSAILQVFHRTRHLSVGVKAMMQRFQDAEINLRLRPESVGVAPTRWSTSADARVAVLTD